MLYVLYNVIWMLYGLHIIYIYILGWNTIHGSVAIWAVGYRLIGLQGPLWWLLINPAIHLGCTKPCKENKINLQPQLVQPPDFRHQHYHYRYPLGNLNFRGVIENQWPSLRFYRTRLFNDLENLLRDGDFSPSFQGRSPTSLGGSSHGP